MSFLPDETCFRIDTLEEYARHVDSLRQSYQKFLPTPTSLMTCISTGCYHFLKGPISWMQAKASCEEMNMRLAEIETEEENRALTNEARNMLRPIEAKYLWIGLTDRATEGTWVWSSGREATYMPWCSGQPDNYGRVEHCALMDIFYNKPLGKWSDFNCDSGNSGTATFGAICKLS